MDEATLDAIWMVELETGEHVLVDVKTGEIIVRQSELDGGKL